MDRPVLGCLARSKKGHDTGRIYIITVKVSDDFVLVADGKLKKLENPKLKRLKHLTLLSQSCLGETVTDKSIRDAIKDFSAKQGGYNA